MRYLALLLISGLILAMLGFTPGPSRAFATFGTRAQGERTVAATFNNSASISVTDRPAGGQPGKASAYPSNIVVSGLTGTVGKVTVTLSNVTHSFPDDFDVLLVGPSGERALIMSDVGGGQDFNNGTLTFDQTAANLIPDSTPFSSGTYKPSNYAGEPTLEPDGIDIFPSPGPGQGNFPSDLNVFNGTVPNGTWQLFIVDDENGDSGMIAGGWSMTISTGSARTAFDFDGDGKADISVQRSSTGAWYRLNSSNGGFLGTQYGASGDRSVPADFDGDGKTDIAVFRPSTGAWYVLNSATNTTTSAAFGALNDLPVPADYDGDGKADIGVYRPSNGAWYRLNSSNGQFVPTIFGLSTDKPAAGDFDGDGKADINVFRPSTGTWYRLNSGNGQLVSTQFGANGDQTTPADYDGDGKADISLFRPSTGDWYRLNSSTGAFVNVHFGSNGDIPAAADFDGDGKADVAIFRPSIGTWYMQQSTAGFTSAAFGASGDTPGPGSFVY
jgi:subtilisin-like proprotein convertase family protein